MLLSSTIQRKMNDMDHPIYSRFEKDELILRDELAIDRTLLSNERTLLVYLRFGVALSIAGVSIIQFSQEGWFWIMGLSCIPIGIVVGISGVTRYRKMYRSILRIRQKTISDSSEGNKDSKPSSEDDPNHQSV
jgi:putative membrane protein